MEKFKKIKCNNLHLVIGGATIRTEVGKLLKATGCTHDEHYDRNDNNTVDSGDSYRFYFSE